MERAVLKCYELQINVTETFFNLFDTMADVVASQFYHHVPFCSDLRVYLWFIVLTLSLLQVAYIQYTFNLLMSMNTA